MVLRIIVFVMMALGLVGFGTVAWLSLQPPTAQASAAAQKVADEAVLVAGRDLQAGSLLKPDDIGLVRMPTEKVPAGASLDSQASRQQLIGSMVRRRLGAGETLLPADLLRPGDHGFLAAVLGAGMRAVTIGVDAITGSAGLIWPGDKVDVLLTHQLEGPGLAPGKRVAAETVLQNVRVIAIDQQLVQGASPGSADSKPATTVTLEVTADDAERVSVAVRLGRLSLVVRSARPTPPDDKPNPGPAITWAGDVSPALNSDTKVLTPNVVKVYPGNAAGTEYKF
ncbi:MAG: Flp pilus assembly protein CpaB [Rhodospirillales bacterium]|nr:Flp pilus assembly protein CpaB [Rhodospirillales bacterium]MDE2197818.1 Flp pilus assembly protein CpaB [Rhodospirillales bacterium]MDE2575901.1 Flp pilus assembly protein CpaB [Rhodospirillales bacterium]